MYSEKVVGYHLADSSAIPEITLEGDPLCKRIRGHPKLCNGRYVTPPPPPQQRTKFYQCQLLSPVSAYSLILEMGLTMITDQRWATVGDLNGGNMQRNSSDVFSL